MKTALLVPFLTVAAAAQSFAVTDFGAQCGADLHGQLHHTTPHTSDLLLAVTGAQPHAFAVLAIGHVAPTPHHLPGSQCLLLVDPLTTMLATTTGTGTAHFVFHVPPVAPITIDFQALIATFSHQHGLVLETSDGVHLAGT